MNVFDFDKTIVPFDSSREFFRFCLRRYPRIVLKNAPAIAAKGAAYFTDRSDAAPLKEQVFAYLKYLDNTQELIEEFWKYNIGRVNKWYLDMKRDDDVIISASPEFIVKPASDALGAVLLGTKMDIHSGVITGVNCHDEEKVVRFRKEFPYATVEEFYSDSLSDTPMAKLAGKAFLVTKEGNIPWPGI